MLQGKGVLVGLDRRRGCAVRRREIGADRISIRREPVRRKANASSPISPAATIAP